MDAIMMAYVTVVIGGVSLQSAEPVSMDVCAALKAEHPQTMCIDVEPACGKGEAVKCLGRADLEEQPAVKKRTYKRRRTATRYRKRANNDMQQTLAKAL